MRKMQKVAWRGNLPQPTRAVLQLSLAVAVLSMILSVHRDASGLFDITPWEINLEMFAPSVQFWDLAGRRKTSKEQKACTFNPVAGGSKLRSSAKNKPFACRSESFNETQGSAGLHFTDFSELEVKDVDLRAQTWKSAHGEHCRCNALPKCDLSGILPGHGTALEFALALCVLCQQVCTCARASGTCVFFQPPPPFRARAPSFLRYPASRARSALRLHTNLFLLRLLLPAAYARHFTS